MAGAACPPHLAVDGCWPSASATSCTGSMVRGTADLCACRAWLPCSGRGRGIHAERLCSHGGIHTQQEIVDGGLVGASILGASARLQLRLRALVLAPCDGEGSKGRS